VKPVSATFALIALAAAMAGFAQTAPPTQPQPDPATQPSDPSTGKADAQAMMRDCMTQTQAANPSATQKDVKQYCIKQVAQQSSSQPTPHE
jgi:hypothetical protein